MARHIDFDGEVRPPRTPEQFLAELRQLRARSGNPSFRRLARMAEQRVAAAPDGQPVESLPPSTTSEVLSGKRLPRLPRLEFVESFVAACLSAGRASEPTVAAELVRWRELWRSVATPEAREEPAPADRAVKLGHRWYNAGQGRFAQQDALSLIGDPTVGNRYAYGNGDPVNTIDPTGRCSVAELAVGVSAGSAASFSG